MLREGTKHGIEKIEEQCYIQGEDERLHNGEGDKNGEEQWEELDK